MGFAGLVFPPAQVDDSYRHTVIIERSELRISGYAWGLQRAPVLGFRV